MAPNSVTNSLRQSSAVQKSEVSPQPRTLPFYRKLLLVANMAGNEMCVSFEHLYEVTLLQLLGVPALFVSLYPIIAGPLAMILLSFNGYISDKGTNHQYRKIAVLIFNSLLMLSGVSTLILTSVLLLPAGKENSAGLHDANATTEANETAAAGLGNLSYHYTFLTQFSATNDPSSSPGENDSEQEQLSGSRGLFDLSLTAVLGIMGISLIDIGYDANIAASRACFLACSSSADHTSLLVLALVMAAAGGLLNSSFGLIDLSQVFRLGFGEGSILPQTTIQLLLVFVVKVVCLVSTVITAVANIRNIDASVPMPFSSDDGGSKTVHDDSDCSVKCETSYGTFAATKDEQNTTFVVENKGRQQQPPYPIHPDDDLSDALSSSLSNSVTVSYNLEARLYQSTDFSNMYLSRKLNESVRGSSGQSFSRTDEEPLVRPRGRVCCHADPLKVNLGLACAVIYLGSSVVYSYNLYSSQYLASVVMGGDYNAPEGSAELMAYRQGLKIASGGLVLVNCAYVAASALQSKLLNFMGLRLDFCLFNALMVAAILLLMITENVGTYFVANVLYGFQRSALFSVPFIVAKNYIHEKGLERTGGSALGKVVGMVTCMITLNFCTLFLLSGPLVSLTSYNGAPLVVAAVSCLVATCVFTLYGRC